MSFLWVGSQIPLYLYGSVLPDIYAEIGGADGQYLWMVIGYLIPNSALCPFVGALSDLFGRRWVAAFGQVCLLIGPVVVSTAQTMNVAIGGMVICGLGAGFNELIALAGTSEMVPSAKRGMYVGLVVFTILPFCPSPLWAQLITQAAGNWRYVGILVGAWNFVGLILVVFFYKDPIPLTVQRPAKEILREIDYVGGILSTFGVTLFMMGLQWGARQVSDSLADMRDMTHMTHRAHTHDGAVLLGLRPRSRALHPRHHHHHRLLPVGDEIRPIPHGSRRRLLQGPAYHDLCSPYHLPGACGSTSEAPSSCSSLSSSSPQFHLHSVVVVFHLHHHLHHHDRQVCTAAVSCARPFFFFYI
jgi:hypothetical protein